MKPCTVIYLRLANTRRSTADSMASASEIGSYTDAELQQFCDFKNYHQTLERDLACRDHDGGLIELTTRYPFVPLAELPPSTECPYPVVEPIGFTFNRDPPSGFHKLCPEIADAISGVRGVMAVGNAVDCIFAPRIHDTYIDYSFNDTNTVHLYIIAPNESEGEVIWQTLVTRLGRVYNRQCFDPVTVLDVAGDTTTVRALKAGKNEKVIISRTIYRSATSLLCSFPTPMVGYQDDGEGIRYLTTPLGALMVTSGIVCIEPGRCLPGDERWLNRCVYAGYAIGFPYVTMEKLMQEHNDIKRIISLPHCDIILDDAPAKTGRLTGLVEVHKTAARDTHLSYWTGFGFDDTEANLAILTSGAHQWVKYSKLIDANNRLKLQQLSTDTPRCATVGDLFTRTDFDSALKKAVDHVFAWGDTAAVNRRQLIIHSLHLHQLGLNDAQVRQFVETVKVHRSGHYWETTFTPDILLRPYTDSARALYEAAAPKPVVWWAMDDPKRISEEYARSAPFAWYGRAMTPYGDPPMAPRNATHLTESQLDAVNAAFAAIISIETLVAKNELNVEAVNGLLMRCIDQLKASCPTTVSGRTATRVASVAIETLLTLHEEMLNTPDSVYDALGELFRLC
jgi:hypothetical protein